MKVADAVGRALAELGIDTVFGVVGSGNFHVTNALVSSGARFVAARHEGGAATMADAFARTSGRPVAVSVHQGPGLTNALTGVTEAAKSRTPLLVLAGATALPDVRSNFVIDQESAVRALGAVSETLTTPRTAVAEAARAFRRAVLDRRTVVLHMPLDVQDAECPEDARAVPVPPVVVAPTASAAGVVALADLLAAAERPVLLAGRGARDPRARAALEALAETCGALLATTAVARGLFTGHPWSVDVSGGFASPLTAELLSGADVTIAWGASLNTWTTRGGDLFPPTTRVAQVDLDVEAIGAHRPVDLGVVGDVAETALAVATELRRRGVTGPGYRDPALRDRIQREVRWRDVPFDDTSDARHIDPRVLSVELDDVLPSERVVVPDGGNFNGYPSMFLAVPDEQGFCMPLAFQSIGLALAGAIGAAVARPDRVAVAGMGDGGFTMSLVELETAVRLRLPLVVVVYDDHAYGAEVHHFGPGGDPLDTVVFPDVDLAAIARGFGCTAVTVRRREDLEAVADWVAGPRAAPLVIDAKITSFPSWVLAHTFGQETEPEA